MKNSGFIMRFSLWFVIMCALFSFSSAVALAQISACPSDMTNYWMFDETSGTSFTDAVGGKNAFCTGTADCPSFASPGRISSALIFDGINDGINVPADTSFNWGAGDSFSIEFWMKSDSLNSCTGNQVIIGRDDEPATGLQWWVGCKEGGSAAFYLFNNDGNGTGLTSTRKLNDGNWHHVVAVRDAGNNTIMLYLDGLKEGSASIAYQNGFASSSSALNIGWLNYPYNSEGFHFAGTIDEVALYKRVLSEKEILSHYYLVRGYCEMCASPVNIMPLGDSTTRGSMPELTPDQYVAFRQLLYWDLLNTGHTVNFVGSLQDGQSAVPAFDIDHEGHGGYTVAVGGGIASNVYNWLTTQANAGNPVNAILLHIGTNDVTLGIQKASDVAAILNEIDRYSKNIPVVIAKIVNRYDNATFETNTGIFNADVEAMVNSRIASGDKIIMVDMYGDAASGTYPFLGAGDISSDGVHPNMTGYDKMAGVWFAALNNFLPVCVNSVPSTYTISATAGTGGKITPSNSVSVNYGASQTFTITPSTGYRIADVKVDGVSVGAVSTYTFSNVTANHTIKATFKRVPHIKVNPVSLDFDKVVTGMTKKQGITISNAGAETMTVSKVEIIGKDGTSFSLPQTVPTTINTSVSINLMVNFTPTSPGRKNAVLLITSDDPDTPVLSIPLKGIGSPNTSVFF